MPIGSLVPAWDRAGVDPCWSGPGGDVFVLGAGFSIAVSEELGDEHRFPDTAQLGRRAIVRLGIAAARDAAEAGWSEKRLDGRGFEGWLAGLAEDQPYMSSAENLRRRALYLELVKSMRAVLVECEERVAEIPSWLLDLVSVWHVRQASIVTFNYDTVIERCLERLSLGAASDGGSIASGDVLDGIPPAAKGGHVVSGSGAATFRLLKLHGSTSWFWAPGDVGGTSVVRLDPEIGASESDRAVSDERSRVLLGRDPFIVPPVAAKTSLYANPITKELWTRAHRALSEARRVYVVGYSCPPVDVTATGLIADTLASRNVDARVEVVNLDADPVSQGLEAAGVTVSRRHSRAGAVKKFVAGYVEDTAVYVVEHLRSWQPEPRNGFVRLVWGSPQHPSHQSDISTYIDNARRTLVVTPVEDDSPTWDLNTFFDDLRNVDRIVVEVSRRQHAVIDWIPTAQQRIVDDAAVVDLWFVNLMPLGRPPAWLLPVHYLYSSSC